MLGRRDPQRSLFAASNYFGEGAVEELGFYGKLAAEGRRLFRDEDFAGAYREDFGRPSVPPSLLACARLLQHYDGVSDAEVVERCRFDLRWKAALDLEMGDLRAPFAKSTYQAFRARLTLHAKEGMAFERSVKAAREGGLLPKTLTVALDSSPVRGRGAVKDTFNLLSDAIAAVLRGVAEARGCKVTELAEETKLARHILAPSLKGSEVVDWEDAASVGTFLQGLMEDCDRAVALAKVEKCATEEAALLKKVLAQDVERDGPGGMPEIKKGVAPGRTVSVHDPEMRHGHKSTGKVYNGHKGHVAVDTGSGVITALDVTSPSEPDGGQVRALIEETERTTGRKVTRALGDTAYGTREGVAQAEAVEVDLLAKMPHPPKGFFGPGDFRVSRDREKGICPAGHASAKTHRRRDARLLKWSPQTCGACPLKGRCTKATKRTLFVPVDFHERRRRERRARSLRGRRLLRRRVTAEHALGRLKRRGAGAAWRFGRRKTREQWLWTAAVVNLSLIWASEKTVAA